jgi:hypothetical protein
MAKTSSKKLTKYVPSSTIVTAEAANTWYGGLYGSPEGDAYEVDDPLVAGHIHDGKHQDGHAQKIDLVDHVTGKITNGNIGTGAVNTRTIYKSTAQEDAIPEYKFIDSTKYYYLDLSHVRDDFAFVRDSGIVSNKTGDLSSDDFVFGSETLNDAGNPDHDSRVLFDKSKGAFRAGVVQADQWDNSNLGDYSVAFGRNTTSSSDYSVVSGGWLNEATSFASSVGGGRGNVASSSYAVIGGGNVNVASGGSASILGGQENIVSAIYSSILGGQENEVSGEFSSVLGGQYNLVESDYSSIVDGYSNSISGIANYSSILGGRENLIDGEAEYASAMGYKANATSYGERAYSAYSLGGDPGGSQESTLIFTASFNSDDINPSQDVELYLDGSVNDSLRARTPDSACLYIDCQLLVVSETTGGIIPTVRYGARKSFLLLAVTGAVDSGTIYEVLGNDGQLWDLSISFTASSPYNLWNVKITGVTAASVRAKYAMCICRIAQVFKP